jgi:hypothetical protein
MLSDGQQFTTKFLSTGLGRESGPCRILSPNERRKSVHFYQLRVRQIPCRCHPRHGHPEQIGALPIVEPEESSFSLRSVDQFLTRDAIANPWNRFQALAVNLLPAVQALAECALIDPFQRGIDRTQQRPVPRLLTKIKLSRQRRVGAIALVLAVVVLRSQ